MEHHHHTASATNLTRAFVVGIVINALYVIIELAAGLYYHSLSLISDAGHNLSDVAALGLALLAFSLTKARSNDTFTYGYRKSTILVSLVNAVILFAAIGGIVWESIDRLRNPVPVAGGPIMIIAGIGIVINAVSAFLFFKDKESDLNVKGAYLHLMADAGVSLGVVVSGLLIFLTHLYWIDTAVSFLVVLVIFYSTWGLFKESLALTLDGVPHGIDLKEVVATIRKEPGVLGVHHPHVWAMSTTQNALTVHLVVSSTAAMETLAMLKKNIKHELEHLNIHHVTIEFETEDEQCADCIQHATGGYSHDD